MVSKTWEITASILTRKKSHSGCSLPTPFPASFTKTGSWCLKKFCFELDTPRAPSLVPVVFLELLFLREHPLELLGLFFLVWELGEEKLEMGFQKQAAVNVYFCDVTD